MSSSRCGHERLARGGAAGRRRGTPVRARARQSGGRRSGDEVIPVELGGVTTLVSPRSSVQWVEAEGDYARLHTVDRFASRAYPDLDAREPLGGRRVPAGSPVVPGALPLVTGIRSCRLRPGGAVWPGTATRGRWSCRSAGGTPGNSRIASSAAQCRRGRRGEHPPGGSRRPRQRVVLAQRRGARIVRTRVEVQSRPRSATR